VTAQRVEQRAIVVELTAPLECALGGGLVLPEVGRRGGRLELGQLAG
jgi:hypothetical protein